LIDLCICCCFLACCLSCVGFSVRDVSAVKTALRHLQVDRFDAFEQVIVVHEVVVKPYQGSTPLFVRIRGGRDQAVTTRGDMGIFEQPLVLYVDQGVHTVTIDVVDGPLVGAKILAEMSLDVMRDLLERRRDITEHVYFMPVTAPGIDSAQIKLSLPRAGMGTESMPLLKNEEEVGERMIVNIAERCKGLLDTFSGSGARQRVRVETHGPPDYPEWMILIWKNPFESQATDAADVNIKVRRIHSIEVDEKRAKVFSIVWGGGYIHRPNVTQFECVEGGGAREEWVDKLQTLERLVKADSPASPVGGGSSPRQPTFSGN